MPKRTPKKQPDWLFSDEELESMSDGYNKAVALWDNGIICESDASNIFIASVSDWDNPGCPHCGLHGDAHWRVGDFRWKCRGCRQKFSIKTGRYLDNNKLSLPVLWRFCWLISKCKLPNSHAIARDLGITQKTSWLLIQTVKQALRDSGIVIKNNAMNFGSIDEVIKLMMRVLPESLLETKRPHNFMAKK